MPRSFSSAIQSEVAWRAALRPLTEPAIWIAPPNSSSFSVSVVLPASGCEMIAKVRRRWVSRRCSDMAGPQPGPRGQFQGRAADYTPTPGSDPLLRPRGQTPDSDPGGDFLTKGRVGMLSPHCRAPGRLATSPAGDRHAPSPQIQ